VSQLTYGAGPKGSLRLRNAAASFLNSNFKSLIPVNFEEVIVFPGLTGCLDALSWCICNEGEAIIIPRPIYPGFKADIPVRSRGVLVTASFQDIDGYHDFDSVFDANMNKLALEAAIEKATKDGITCRGLIMSKYEAP
jgi:aspartate/methionine/tyrosine aminotransferase